MTPKVVGLILASLIVVGLVAERSGERRARIADATTLADSVRRAKAGAADSAVRAFKESLGPIGVWRDSIRVKDGLLRVAQHRADSLKVVVNQTLQASEALVRDSLATADSLRSPPRQPAVGRLSLCVALAVLRRPDDDLLGNECGR